MDLGIYLWLNAIPSWIVSIMSVVGMPLINFLHLIVLRVKNPIHINLVLKFVIGWSELFLIYIHILLSYSKKLQEKIPCLIINPRSVDIAANSSVNFKLKSLEVSMNVVLIQSYCSGLSDGQ